VSRFVSRIGALFVSFLGASSALAQAVPPAPSEPAVPGDSAMVEEVVVTARRREEAQESVPASVTALGARQLERSEVRDLGDLEALAPNTIIDWLPISPGAASIFIRGIGVSEADKTFDPAIAVMIDGVYIGTNTSALLNNFDLEAVEVLRGPQGALFGRNSTGGVISVRRKKPTGELGLRASATVGSWGRHDYKLVGDFPIVEGVLAGKLSFYALNMKGLLENEATGEVLPDSHYFSGIADLLYTPTQKLSVHLKYERSRDRQQSLPPQNASDPSHLLCATFQQCADGDQGKYEVRSDFRNDMGLDLDAVTLDARYELGPLRLISVSGYRGYDEDVFQDFDGTTLSFFSMRRTQRYDQISEELRLEGPLFDRVEAVVGLFYFYGHFDMDATTFFLDDLPTRKPELEERYGRPLGPGLVRVQDVGQSTHSIAGFASFDVDVVDRLRASVGGRYTYERKRFYSDWGHSNYLDSAEARMVEALDDQPILRARRHWDRFTPRASLDYTIDDRVLARGDEAMLYASYAQGFRSGGFSARADPATREAFDPEVVHQYEAGLKTSFLSRRLLGNLAVFYTDLRDKQEELIVRSQFGEQTITRNAARAEIRGLEVELAAMPLHGLTSLAGDLRLWGSLGLLDAEYQHFDVDFDGNSPDRPANSRNHPGLRMRYAPRYQYAAGIDSPWRIGDDFRVMVSGQYRGRSPYRSSFTVNEANHVDQRGVAPAYGQLDLSLSFEALNFLHGKWRLTAFGRNVLGTTTRLLYAEVAELFAVRAYNMPAHWGGEIAATY
jgi:iron complex outermembrane receptor protein